jgi:hypothetical protein
MAAEYHTFGNSPNKPGRCTYAGRPFGDEEFIVRLENQFKRNWRRGSFEKAVSAA